MAHRFPGKQIKPLVHPRRHHHHHHHLCRCHSRLLSAAPLGRGKLFKGPASLSREHHNASGRLYTGLYGGGGGFAAGGTISTLHMGIGNARRSRRIIRTPSAIPKLCWMHANCREGTHIHIHPVYLQGVFPYILIAIVTTDSSSLRSFSLYSLYLVIFLALRSRGLEKSEFPGSFSLEKHSNDSPPSEAPPRTREVDSRAPLGEFDESRLIIARIRLCCLGFEQN